MTPFQPVSTRTLVVSFDPVLGVHRCLPLVFGVNFIGVLTMAVHACLVTVCIPDGKCVICFV